MRAIAVADRAVGSDPAELVRRYFDWAPRVSGGARAEAVSALARAYLYCDWEKKSRAAAELALTAALDDLDPRVRRALAEAFASARAAPRRIVLALASDVAEVARPLLMLSPVLTDADLIDAIAHGDSAAHHAVANRTVLRASVAASLTEACDSAAALALLANAQAELSPTLLWRLFDRLGASAELRAALADRGRLPPSLRAALAATTAADVAEFAAACQALEPRRASSLAQEGREQAFASIALRCTQDELPDLVRWLRASGHLTVGLLLRALAGGNASLLQQSLVELTGASARRVEGLLRNSHGWGFAALCRNAGFPDHIVSVLRIALKLSADAPFRDGESGVNAELAQQIARAIDVRRNPALASVEAKLWRLASEGAREDAREFASGLPPLPALTRMSAPPPVLMLEARVNYTSAPSVTIDNETPFRVAA